jgi:hypothetical protein
MTAKVLALAYCAVATFGMLTAEGFGMRLITCAGIIMYALMKE